MSTPRELEMQHSAGTYLKREISLVSGKGVRVTDEDGKSYIDCISGIGVAALGHAHPGLTSAIAEQAGTIISAPELLCTPMRREYQAKLLSHFADGFERVFLCNSGAEALEGALKFARFSSEKHGILALKKGFHGKTLGALTSTAEPKYRDPFAPLLPDGFHVKAGDLEGLKNLFEESGDKIGAFVFEAIQGEGGINPLDAEFITQAVELARANGTLIVADEVQSGFGRTGKMWAFEHLGIEPDLVCMAKAIAGGVPMGAIAIGSRVKELAPQSHTSTFGGNPLACRAGLAVLDAIENEKLIENAAAIGEHITTSLQENNIKLIREIRGKGLMIGIELKQRAGQFIAPLAEKGILALLAGPRVIRLLPPLIINKEEADEIVTALTEVLTA